MFCESHKKSFLFFFTAGSKYVDVEDFVEMTKKFTENISRTPTLSTLSIDANREETERIRHADTATFQKVRIYKQD